MRSRPRRTWRISPEIKGVFRLILIYLLIGSLWIVLSDRILEFLVPDRHMYAWLQTIKGWFYVAATSALFGFVAYREFRHLAVLRAREFERERRYRLVVETANEGICTLDAGGVVTYANSAACALLALGPDEIIGQKATDFIHPACPKETLAAIDSESRALLHGKSFVIELPLTGIGGRAIWCAISVTPLYDVHGSFMGSHVVAGNIQARRDYEETIIASLNEKEALLRELNHRVKNNLQLISSLLALRMDRLSNPTERNFFVEFLSRIRAMALVHESVYSSGDLAAVDLGSLARGASFEYSAAFGERDIAFHCTGNTEVPVDIARAVPIALMMNEVILNAVAHAFPDGRKGTVTIDVRGVGNELVLSVRDDGIGFDSASIATKSVGMMIIRSLAEQVSGILSYQSSPAGTTFELRVPRVQNHQESSCGE